MAMKGHSTFLKASGLEPYLHIVLCHIQDACWGVGLTPLQRYTRCIQQSHRPGYQPKRKISEVERTFLAIAWNLSLKSQMNLHKELLMVNKTSNSNCLQRKTLTQRWKKLKAEKLHVSMKDILEYGQKGKFDDVFFRLCNAMYTQNTIEK